MKTIQKANAELYEKAIAEDTKIRKLINAIVGGYNFSFNSITPINVSLEDVSKLENIGKLVIKLSNQIDELGE
jgi:hypothetical protein